MQKFKNRNLNISNITTSQRYKNLVKKSKNTIFTLFGRALLIKQSLISETLLIKSNNLLNYWIYQALIIKSVKIGNFPEILDRWLFLKLISCFIFKTVQEFVNIVFYIFT